MKLKIKSNKTERFAGRMSKDEKKEIEKKAKKAGVSISRYMVYAAMNFKKSQK